MHPAMKGNSSHILLQTTKIVKAIESLKLKLPLLTFNELYTY